MVLADRTVAMYLITLLGFVLLHSSKAWTVCPTFQTQRFSTVLFNNNVQIISLQELTNHEEEGTLLAESIARWLDHEWMPQQVHVQMGESAKKSYIAMREAGKDDLMDIMMQVSSDLEQNWKEYDSDAFVSAWDVGNYVADYLTKRSGNEGCECSSQIF